METDVTLDAVHVYQMHTASIADLDLLWLVVGLGIIGTVVAMAMMITWATSKRGKKKMARRERKLLLRQQSIDAYLSDLLVDGLLDAEIDGVMTSQEVAQYTRMFGYSFNLKDLQPRRLYCLKQQIRERLNSGFYGAVKWPPHLVKTNKNLKDFRLATA